MKALHIQSVEYPVPSTRVVPIAALVLASVYNCISGLGNMTDSHVPTYSMKERDHRWSAARNFMAENRLDGVMVFREHEDAGRSATTFDNWLTNGRLGSIVVLP